MSTFRTAGGRGSRRARALFGLAAGTVVVAMASAAFACTTYQGKLLVTNKTTGSGSATASGNGAAHGTCAPAGSTSASANATAQHVLTVTVSPATDASCNVSPTSPRPGGDRLHSGVYDVNILKWVSATVAGDCMTVAGDPGTVKVGIIAVLPTGDGSADVQLPNLGLTAATKYSLCVADQMLPGGSTLGFGLQVKLLTLA